MIRYKWIYSILILLLVGCGKQSKPRTSLDDKNFHDTQGLSQTSEDLVYADGWDQLIINANYTTTTVGAVGAHFKTQRNSCFTEAYGSVSMESWNPLAIGINYAIASGPPNLWYCIPLTENYQKYNYDTIKVKIDGKQRTLFENFDGQQICSTINDREISKNLLNAINGVIETAWKQDCSTGNPL